MKTFFKYTDNKDINENCIGVAVSSGYENKGLRVQIRHNGVPELLRTANKMADIIEAALNEALKSGELKLPKGSIT